jgi:hypothetical protein
MSDGTASFSVTVKTSLNNILTTIIVDTGTSLNIIGGDFFNSYFRTIVPLYYPRIQKLQQQMDNL